jgi:hypothetical protein
MSDIGPAFAQIMFGTSFDLFNLWWRNDTPMRGKQAKMDLEYTWKDTRELVVDELFTMTGKHFVAIDQHFFLTMRDCGRTPNSLNSLIGEIRVGLTGDHHQNRPGIRLYAYQTNECQADYKNNYNVAISDGYVPRCIPAFWTTTEIDIRSRSPVNERLLANPI